ncbi:MAG: DEAD/DEAH box helicase [Ignavibacteria bacterium]
MLKDLRTKVAESVQPFQKPEELQWKYWLKVPAHKAMPFNFEETDFISRGYFFDDWLDYVSNFTLNFRLNDMAILQRRAFNRWLKISSTKLKPFILPVARSHRIFFSLVQGKISDKLPLSNSFTPLISRVFNYEHEIAPAEVNEIIFYSQQSETYLISWQNNPALLYDDVQSSGFFLPEQYASLMTDENIYPDNSVFRWELPDIDSSHEFIFYDSFSQLNTDILVNCLFTAKAVSQNLMPAGNDSGFINDKTTSDFFLYQSPPSLNLLDIYVPTYEMELLENSVTRTSAIDIKKLFPDMESKTEKYDQYKLEFKNEISIIKPFASHRLKIKSSGFIVYPVSLDEAPDISRNLLKEAKTSLLAQRGKLSPDEIFLKMVNLTEPDENEISHFPETITKHKDPVYYPSLQNPADFERQIPEQSPNDLYEFQHQGVDMLINNSFALLSDEEGLGNIIQAVFALKNLYKKCGVSSTLIVCNQADIGQAGTNRLSPGAEGWMGYLDTFAPELSVVRLSSDKAKRTGQWNTRADIHLISHNNLLNDEAEEIINYSRLREFNAVILDNYQSFRLTSYQRERIFGRLRLRFLWILDNSPVKSFESNVISYFLSKTVMKSSVFVQNKPINFGNFTLRRLRKEVNTQVPQRIYQNRWLEPTSEQLKEYNTIFEQGQLRLYSSVEKDNLFIIRPQVFAILHEIMQTLNFSANDGLSFKADLLLDEVRHISERKQKIVIFSQYEKYGLKKIEDMFHEHKINFVTCRSGMDDNAIEQVSHTFRTDSGVCAFLADIKAVNKKLDLGNFNHIIHFDQWWNPVSLWLAEDKVCSTNNAPLQIQYYRTAGVIEEKIYQWLPDKGLLNKIIIETLAPSFVADQITINEWLDLFDVQPAPETNASEPVINLNQVMITMGEMDSNKIMDVISQLLIKTGFCRISTISYPGNDNRTVLTASKTISGKEEDILIMTDLNDTVTEEMLNNFISIISSKSNISYGVIITAGIFAPECCRYSVIKNNLLTLIDGRLLAGYLARHRLI